MTILSSFNTADLSSVEPDETARKGPSQRDLHCLPFSFGFMNDITICNNGHIQIKQLEESTSETQGWKGYPNPHHFECIQNFFFFRFF